MSDPVRNRYHYDFIHNVFATFFQDVLDYFANYLNPRFEYKEVTTYDKAVRYLSNMEEYGRELDQPHLPAFILNPSGDFNISELSGMQLWRFPNLAPGQIRYLFDPIYQDQHTMVTVGFTRIKGEIELISLLNSVYEFLDLKLLFLQIFGGMNRIIEPRLFSSFIIIPEELYNYRYENEYTGVSYILDWESAGTTSQLIQTTNKTEHVFPVNIKPWFKLTGMSDGGQRYGGADKLAEWRLVSNVEYEFECPSFLVLETDYLAESLKLNIKYGSAFSVYPDYSPPEYREVIKTKWDHGLEANSDSDPISDATAEIEYTKTLIFKTRYYHVITSNESAETEYVDISLPEIISDPDYLLVNYRYGLMDYGDHYEIVDDGNILRIKKSKVTLLENQILELYVYSDQ